jgi:hypothetical protein
MPLKNQYLFRPFGNDNDLSDTETTKKFMEQVDCAVWYIKRFYQTLPMALVKWAWAQS